MFLLGRDVPKDPKEADELLTSIRYEVIKEEAKQFQEMMELVGGMQTELGQKICLHLMTHSNRVKLDFWLEVVRGMEFKVP